MAGTRSGHPARNAAESRTAEARGRRDALGLIAGGTLAGLAGTLALLPGAEAGSAPAEGVTTAPAVIGVARYQVGTDGTLDGVWTIAAYNGRLGSERATGGTPGVLPGSYRVEIRNPDRDLIFEGTLTIAAQEAAYQMTWTGVDGTRYTGLGLHEDDGPLAAVYWGPVT